jgi:CDP-glucose 4,6-dehydratase
VKLQNFKNLGGPVLITGHTGFKGAWLTVLLDALEIEFVGLSLEPEPESLYSKFKVKNKYQEFFIDIRNLDAIEKIVNSVKPSVIMHLAAQPLVLQAYANPFETYSTNVTGTINVLEAASKNLTTKVVAVVTTDKVYENLDTKKAFREQDKLGGNEPYSASKSATEMLILGWQKVFLDRGGFFPVTLRAGNVIGGGDMAKNRLIPDLVRSLITDQELKIRNAESTRPWQHVLDPLYGYLLAIEKSIHNPSVGAFNFGPTGHDINVQNVIDIALNQWKNKQNIKVKYVKEFQHESKYLNLDSSLSKTHLGWHPKFSQMQSIQLTIDWWDKYIFHKHSAIELCKEETRRYIQTN